jgi:choline dehydrogenase-like flavoprotein
MQLSGIGPGATLAPLGIEVRHEIKGVGENLQDHLQLRCAYKVTGIKTMNETYRNLFKRAGFLMEYVMWKRGPMTMAPSQLGAFVRSDPSRDTPNLQYHVQPLTLPKFGDPLDPFPAFTASVANLRPTSRGWVRITTPDPHAHPEIRPNYLSTQDDRRVAADAIRVTRHIVSRPALARYKPEEFRPGSDIEGDERWPRRWRYRHHHFPPRGHLQDGRRRHRGGGYPPQGAGSHGPQGCRCLGHARHHLGQYQLAHPHDRREGRRDDPGGRSSGAVRRGIVDSSGAGPAHK